MAKTYVLEWLDAVGYVRVSSTAKAVGLACSLHADYGTGHNMRAGMERLAYLAGVSVRQARRGMAELIDAGLVAWDGVPTAPGRARTYALVVPELERRTPASAVTDNNGGHPRPPSGKQRRTPAATVTGATADRFDANGGQNRPKRRTPVSAYQSTTSALPTQREHGALTRTVSAAPGQVENAAQLFTSRGLTDVKVKARKTPDGTVHGWTVTGIGTDTAAVLGKFEHDGYSELSVAIEPTPSRITRAEAFADEHDLFTEIGPQGHVLIASPCEADVATVLDLLLTFIESEAA